MIKNKEYVPEEDDNEEDDDDDDEDYNNDQIQDMERATRT